MLRTLHNFGRKTRLLGIMCSLDDVGRLKHSGVQADLVTILPSVGLTIIVVTAVFTLPG